LHRILLLRKEHHVTTTIEHVRSHTGIIGNDTADALATKANRFIDKPSRCPLHHITTQILKDQYLLGLHRSDSLTDHCRFRDKLLSMVKAKTGWRSSFTNKAWTSMRTLIS
jgi:hypothetical protein